METEIVLSDKEHVNHGVSVYVSEIEEVVGLRRHLLSGYQTERVEAFQHTCVGGIILRVIFGLLLALSTKVDLVICPPCVGVDHCEKEVTQTVTVEIDLGNGVGNGKFSLTGQTFATQEATFGFISAKHGLLKISNHKLFRISRLKSYLELVRSCSI